MDNCVTAGSDDLLICFMHWGCALFWCSCVKHGSFHSPSLGLSTVRVLYVLISRACTRPLGLLVSENARAIFCSLSITVYSLQHDGCHITSNAIMTACFRQRLTRQAPHPHLHFNTSAIFNPLGFLQGRLGEG